MTVRFRDYLQERLKDPEFRAEYETLELKEAVMQDMISAITATGLTNEELSQRTGISKASLSKIKSGKLNPSLTTLQKLAHGINKKLKFELVPASQL